MDYPAFEGQIGDCERADIDALGLSQLLADADTQDIRAHSVICIRNGVRVLDVSVEPFRTDLPQETYSMSKSFVSAAVGIAQEKGLLGLDDRIVDLLGRSGKQHQQ